MENIKPARIASTWERIGTNTILGNWQELWLGNQYKLKHEQGFHFAENMLVLMNKATMILTITSKQPISRTQNTRRPLGIPTKNLLGSYTILSWFRVYKASWYRNLSCCGDCIKIHVQQPSHWPIYSSGGLVLYWDRFGNFVNSQTLFVQFLLCFYARSPAHLGRSQAQQSIHGPLALLGSATGTRGCTNEVRRRHLHSLLGLGLRLNTFSHRQDKRIRKPDNPVIATWTTDHSEPQML